jgi:hypothetical protein
MHKEVLPFPLGFLLLLLALDGPIQPLCLLTLCDIDDLFLNLWSPEALIILVLLDEVTNFTFKVKFLRLVLEELLYKEGKDLEKYFRVLSQLLHSLPLW